MIEYDYETSKRVEAKELIELLENHYKEAINEFNVKPLEKTIIEEEKERRKLVSMHDKRALQKLDKEMEDDRKEIAAYRSYLDIVMIVKGALGFNYKQNKVKRPSSLQKLAEFKTGNQTLNADNQRLLDEFERVAERDESLVNRGVDEKIQGAIAKIRENNYYKLRKKRARDNILDLHNPDENKVGPGANSVRNREGRIEYREMPTFAELFRQLTELMRHFYYCHIDYDFDDKYEVPKGNRTRYTTIDYSGRLDEYDKRMKELRDTFDNNSKYATSQEKAAFEKAYSEAEKARKRFSKHSLFDKIFNLYRQVDAIDNAIRVLESNNQKIYTQSLEFLRTKRIECMNTISRLGEDRIKNTMSLFNQVADKIENMVKEVKVRGDAARAKLEEDKRKERIEERKREEENERIERAARRSREELRQMKARQVMEELKPEVLKQVDLKLIRHTQTGIDSWKTDDTEYVDEFVRKMRIALQQRGINPEGISIISPYEDNYSSGYRR